VGQDGETLGAGDRDVEAVGVKEEVDPARYSSPAEQVIAKKTTDARWPWKRSTVPTCAPARTCSRMQCTARLYGATMRMSGSTRGACSRRRR